MAALKAGDERNLPVRDRGPVRKYARDLVDARRSVAEFFLPFALVILVLSFAPNSQWKAIGSTLWLVLVVLIIADSVVMAMRLRRGLRKNLPDQPTKGVAAVRADAQHADPPVPAAAAPSPRRPPPQLAAGVAASRRVSAAQARAVLRGVRGGHGRVAHDDVAERLVDPGHQLGRDRDARPP